MEHRVKLSQDQKAALDAVFEQFGYKDYKWVDPAKIIVSQWVRMKCTFGCGNYGHDATCPPNTPSVEECERFFHEYSDAVVFRFNTKLEKPEDRHAWTRKINTGLNKLEREVFCMGHERTFLLYMDSCELCKECAGSRENCQNPRLARPAPEAMAVDVYSTVRQFGFPIQVLPDYDQAMNRYSFLMIS